MSLSTTFAGFSDTEEVTENTFETGSLDLLVARYVDNCAIDTPEFCDDQPWGTGLFPERVDNEIVAIVPCFKVEAEPELGFAASYTCNLLLWNSGCVHGKFYIHIRDVNGIPPTLLTNTTVTIWYDLDNDGDDLDSEGKIDETETITGTLQELACQPLPLEPLVWLLPAEGVRSLQITIDPPPGAPGDSLTFNIQFGLKGIVFVGTSMIEIGFCDTEICLDNCLEVKEEETPEP